MVELIVAKISVVVSVVREEIGVLARALDSVKDLAFEIVVVDMSGTSEVKEIVGKYKAELFSHEFSPYVEPVRNFGISKTKGDWILILDPDEEIPGPLARKLKKLSEKPTADFYRLPRKNIVFGKWLKYSRWWPDYIVRFFKKGTVSWGEAIHWVPVTNGIGKELEPKEDFAIVHHHYDSIEQYTERLNRYTSIQADLIGKKNYEFSWVDLIKKPSGEFLSRFFAGDGYKDGVHGLALALLQGFSELIVYLKVWQKKGFDESAIKLDEFSKAAGEAGRDLRYWQADAKVKSGGGILHKIKRKFKI